MQTSAALSATQVKTDYGIGGVLLVILVIKTSAALRTTQMNVLVVWWCVIGDENCVYCFDCFNETNDEGGMVIMMMMVVKMPVPPGLLSSLFFSS